MRFDFTTEELMDRWEDQRDIQNLMGKYSYHYLLKKEKDIFDTFWSHDAEDLSLAVNDGYFLGAESIRGYYDAFHRETLLRTKVMQQVFPEELGGKDLGSIYGVGCMDYHPMTTHVIEIAADGKTAKGMWYCQASFDRVTSAGPLAYWVWATYSVDFIREHGEWKIWHMINVEDVRCPHGDKWAETPKQRPVMEEFREMDELTWPEPDVKMPVREYYHTDRKLTPLPRVPEPYGTFADTFSYGYVGKE